MTLRQAFELALQHHQSGRLAEAETLYRQILAVEPRHADALHLLGVIAHQVGRHDVAVDLIRQAIALAPGVADYHSNLGEAYRAARQLDEAIAAYHRAITLQPNLPEACCNLGNALKDQGHFEEAVASYRQALALRPSFSEAYLNLGVALRHQGKLDEAIAACRQAIALQPRAPQAHNNLGNALHGKVQLKEAIAAYRQAIALQPDFPEAHNNLGVALHDDDQFEEAVAACRQAIARQPASPAAHNNLGNALKAQGRMDEAIAAYRQAVALQPNLPDTHSNLLFALNYHPGIEARAIAEEHRRWNQQHAEPLRPCLAPHPNHPDPERRLRVGYVSPDFREHSVACFVEPLLAGHDPTLVEVFCYANVTRPDAVTARLQQHAAHWRNIAGLSDARVAELIRQDGIDLLVDLAGHTGGNRLLVFARKPAPVQVTWLGYPGSTGLQTIDYRLTDTLADPPGAEEQLHTEELVRLPQGAWCFLPSEVAPPVSAPPVREAGHVTFGCFNTRPKINAPLLKLWSEILRATPGSRLLLKNRAALDASTQKHLQAELEHAGIAPERVEILAPTAGVAEHLAAYGRVDIALDTFPYHGTTTTCEALWMGVPVVTLAGHTHASRVGVSLLTNVGLPALIAAHEDEYIRIAAALAADLPRLAHLRATLRAQMAASPLMDAPRFARNVEQAYRQMWRTWCARQS